MATTFEKIRDEIAAGKYQPVYMLAGEEPYYIDKVADMVEANALDEMAKSFDQQVVYGRDLQDISQALGLCQQFPMMGDRRVVIVREAQAVKKWENFDKYWKNPVMQTILVVCYKGKPNGTHTAFKGLKDTPYYLDSVRLRDYQINGWITNYIKEWNARSNKSGEVTIQPNVVQILADALGSDLQRIEKELEKLVNGCPEGTTTIDAALVERNIGISKDFNSFELIQAMVMGDVVKANRIVQYFAANPREHTIIKELPLIFRFFSNLMLYLYLPQRDEKTVMSALGVNWQGAKDLQNASRRYTKAKTFAIIGYIREADAKSKGIDYPNASNEADIWKELIFKIMH